MELLNAIASYFDIPNCEVTNLKVIGKDIFFSVRNGGEWSATLVRGKFLKKNSIRRF